MEQMGVPSTNPDPEPEMAASPDAHSAASASTDECNPSGFAGSPLAPDPHWTWQESPQLLLSRSTVLGEGKGGNYFIVHTSICTKAGMRGNPKMGPFRDT